MAKKKSIKQPQTRRPVRAVVHAAEMSPEVFRQRHRSIFMLRDEAEQLLGHLIRECGWVNTNQHAPRMLWKWEKKIGNTILIADTAETALQIQDRLSCDVVP